ncbi:MAG: hypothetical protein WCR52_06845 [Bacteroidota bacterium]
MQKQQRTIIINEHPTGWGWILAFFLLAFIFLQRECGDVFRDLPATNNSKPAITKSDRDAIPIPEFQETAPRFNGRPVTVGPCRTTKCRPFDKRSYITDFKQSKSVLASCPTGFPDTTVYFYAVGTPLIHTNGNTIFWELSDVKWYPIN